MLGAVKMEGHDHSDWSTYYGEPEVGRVYIYLFSSIQLNISPEVILTL